MTEHDEKILLDDYNLYTVFVKRFTAIGNEMAIHQGCLTRKSDNDFKMFKLDELFKLEKRLKDIETENIKLKKENINLYNNINSINVKLNELYYLPPGLGGPGFHKTMNNIETYRLNKSREFEDIY